jgi:hypothetical protein
MLSHCWIAMRFGGVPSMASMGFAPAPPAPLRRELPEILAMEHSRKPAHSTDRILRSAPTAPARQSPEETTNHAGQSALDLIRQVAIAIESNDTRTKATLQQLINEITVAEERIRELETRALSAESRATEAEKWLVLLHDSLRQMDCSLRSLLPSGVSHFQPEARAEEGTMGDVGRLGGSAGVGRAEVPALRSA